MKKINLLFIMLAFQMVALKSQALSYALAVECRTSSGLSQVELSGMLKLKAAADGQFKILSSSYIYKLGAGQSQQMSLVSGLVSSSGEVSHVHLTFADGLRVDALISGDPDQQPAGTLSQSGKDLQSLHCSPREINEQHFSLERLLQSSFPD